MSEASDLFGAVATAYARHRLTYPAPFFEAFTARLGHGARVWDCGCGSGQAALDLAERGLQVIATDASAAQLAAGRPHPLIEYRLAPAEASGLESASVDGVLVAAAVHWFDAEAFNAEVRRVARPGALLAWIGYLPLQIPDARLQSTLEQFRTVVLRPWWAPECDWVEQRYAGLAFPGLEEPFLQGLWIERHWRLSDLLGHIGTWSALQRSRHQGLELLEPLEAALGRQWPGQGSTPLPLRWPFMGRWGRVDPAGDGAGGPGPMR
ncbi:MULTISPECIES: class I SAM-dependent methyltransferase [Aphanothece]|uniref:class I SAM-dependent methyltransferase n=1 Tax=Aphanothece TaxID=1121 RepID=UPI00398523B7